MLLVDDTQNPITGQSYVRYPLGGGLALARGSALLTRLLTNMRLIVMNWAMLYVMISECYLIDDGYMGR
jgi:hypothetical protein